MDPSMSGDDSTKIRMVDPSAKAVFQALRERFIADPRGTDLSQLRPVIARSWQRSMACNVSPETKIFAAVAEPQIDEQLLRCAEPVLTDLERMCLETNGCVGLSDPLGTIAVFRGEPSVRRWADRLFPTIGGRMSEDLSGTNSDGTAIEEGTAVQVWSSEHFTEALQDTCCTSVPIRDPLRRSIRGILSLTLPERIAVESDPRSILLIVEGAAAEVTRALAAQMAVREQALLSEYLREIRKRGTEAVLAMDDRTTIASHRAKEFLEQSDYAVLEGYANEALRLQRAVEQDLVLGSGRVIQLQVRPVPCGVETAGTVMRLRRVQPRVAKRSGTKKATSKLDEFSALVGESLSLRRALEAANTACDRHMPAYIVGEAGTGKRLLAQALASRLSKRSVQLDCVANDAVSLSVDGLMDALERGEVIVLSHVEALPTSYRDRLAEALASVDQPRIVLTARRLTDDLLPLVSALRGIEIPMPPLRARREDIPLLVNHFLRERGAFRASARLVEALASADLPGNVRQLKEMVESAANHAVGTEVGLDELAVAHRRALARSPLTRLEEAELQQIREALAEASGNRLKAAAILQIGRSTLYRKIDTYTRRGYDLGL